MGSIYQTRKPVKIEDAAMFIKEMCVKLYPYMTELFLRHVGGHVDGSECIKMFADLIERNKAIPRVVDSKAIAAVSSPAGRASNTGWMDTPREMKTRVSLADILDPDEDTIASMQLDSEWDDEDDI